MLMYVCECCVCEWMRVGVGGGWGGWLGGECLRCVLEVLFRALIMVRQSQVG